MEVCQAPLGNFNICFQMKSQGHFQSEVMTVQRQPGTFLGRLRPCLKFPTLQVEEWAFRASWPPYCRLCLLSKGLWARAVLLSSWRYGKVSH